MPEPIKPYQEFVDKNYNPNSKLDWRPESWLGERAESVTGPKYTEEDVRIFRSHVPEYKKIEREARKNGTWLQMPNGTTWTGDPREWVMMQSEAFKKNYQENPWYTGQAEWATKVTLPDGTVVDTDKVKRARYHNGEMWFSDDAGYAQYFADAVGEGGIGRRNENYETSDVRGKVFLSAIPKKGNYRYLYNNSKGDLWWDMPYDLTDNDIVRSKKIGKSKNDKWIIKSEGLNLKTDDIVNHSKKLGDDGIFMFNVMDGPVRRNIGNLPYYAVPNTGINEEMDPEGPSNSMHLEIPVNEFISQPGFTEKIKFIRGNNGNFDPNTDDKYSAIFKIDSPLFVKKGGRIHIKKKNRGSFTRWCKGKVTEECIRRGKNSSNPAIRKKATFAANARRWKHENGGILKYQNPAITLDLPEGSVYGGELEPAIIKPTPIKAELNTYYPVVSKYPWTGHSELILHNAGPQKSSVIITRGGYNSDYNLITNNCSDSTRCAVEQIYNEKINPILFTTPGDVRDFLLKKGVDKIKTGKGVESQYFEIPFATAMELRNKNIDYQIQDYLKKAEDYKKDTEKLAKSHDRKWNSSSFDESTTKVVQEFEKQKYKFQPFKNKNGGILKAQEGTGNGFWSKLWNAVKAGGMAARDAKLGAVGAQQVRDLYSEGKNQEAQDLAKQYAKANTTGIALAGGAASTSLLGDLMVTGATTAADTFIDGDTENFGKNLSLNAAFDLVGHGTGKLLRNIDWGRARNSVELIPDGTKADVSEYINTVDDALPERQPLTIQKSSQFWDGTSKSKLSVDEKMGLPKGERNQPIKSNPNAGVVTNVDTYLINRAYAPWEIRDGKFIFKMGEPINVRGLSERAPITFHFTTDTQVKPHSGGDSWANAKTTYLVPYKSVVKHNGMPANIEPMDTWWTAGSTFEFPTQDVKVLTADPKVYRQYKARGIDVEFSTEGRKLIRERKGMSDIVEQWIRSKQDQFGMRPTVDTYRQMERETRLSSNVRPKKKHLFGDYFEETNVPDYHTGPTTHSDNWSFPAMANIGLPDDPKYFMSSIARNVARDLSKYKTFTFKDLPALQKLAQTHKQFDIQLPTTYGIKNEYSWDFSGQEELVDKINKILRGEIVVPYEQGGKL